MSKEVKEPLDIIQEFLSGLTENEKAIKMAAFRIAFLMPHQDIHPDLELYALNLTPISENKGEVDKNSREYIIGARDALLTLIHMLEGKGPKL